MNIHFIAIGGSAMHNLAIALNRKGENVSGSDDEIFEPSKSRLKKEGILPNNIGWDTNKINKDLDAIILGMHARIDNPELVKAKELNIPIYSYPEFLYQQSKNKLRIVIGGSHGKTTITSMILHALKKLNIEIDYMVGAQLDGYDCMVKITKEAKMIILEGDEYLSSPIDRRPKFHLYKPNIALLSGIAWDHINVFPTFENYLSQFRIFCDLIEETGSLVYNKEDPEVSKIAQDVNGKIKSSPYSTPIYKVNSDKGTTVQLDNKEYSLELFGAHNLQNLMGAMIVLEKIGINNADFMNSMRNFKGAGKRLQKVAEHKEFILFKDFAHSPSKLKATTSAVKEQFPKKKLIACMELHTFSSLQKSFLSHYKDSMKMADIAIVYFNPEVVAHKKLPPITKKDVLDGFGGNIIVVEKTNEVIRYIQKELTNCTSLLMMSSGNFDGINYEDLSQKLISKLID
ncbi:MAG: Mur ligase family protein [Crocinitomicaceae bacterium]|nr:Mur ligase family protein [Crocinitomicaceae bacterium]